MEMAYVGQGSEAHVPAALCSLFVPGLRQFVSRALFYGASFLYGPL